MLLKRAGWIIDSNILMSCGHTPVLPDDLKTFMEPGLPQPAILAGLLKSVMPAINLADDRTGPIIALGLSKIDHGAAVLEALGEGRFSANEANLRLDVLQKTMNMEDTIELMNLIKRHNEK